MNSEYDDYDGHGKPTVISTTYSMYTLIREIEIKIRRKCQFPLRHWSTI
jgi:hypothetical protein